MTREKNCDNCVYADCQAYEYPCNKCEASYDSPPTKWEPDDTPPTNADHIREMTDEELAKWLCARFDCYGTKPCPAKEECYADHNGMLKWLQQPYKENKDG